jgi:hypothetical protein
MVGGKGREPGRGFSIRPPPCQAATTVERCTGEKQSPPAACINVLISGDGKRIRVSQAFVAACSTLANAGHAAAASGLAGETEWPVPFPASDIEAAVDVFAGLSVTDGRRLLVLADFLASPLLTKAASDALVGIWHELFRQGPDSIDEIFQLTDLGAAIPCRTLAVPVSRFGAAGIAELGPVIREDRSTLYIWLLDSDMDEEAVRVFATLYSDQHRLFRTRFVEPALALWGAEDPRYALLRSYGPLGNAVTAKEVRRRLASLTDAEKEGVDVRDPTVQDAMLLMRRARRANEKHTNALCTRCFFFNWTDKLQICDRCNYQICEVCQPSWARSQCSRCGDTICDRCDTLTHCSTCSSVWCKRCNFLPVARTDEDGCVGCTV